MRRLSCWSAGFSMITSSLTTTVSAEMIKSGGSSGFSFCVCDKIGVVSGLPRVLCNVCRDKADRNLQLVFGTPQVPVPIAGESKKRCLSR